jgi:hypothetical protein
MEVVARLEQAIEAIDGDGAALQSPGVRAAVAHLRAILDFVGED